MAKILISPGKYLQGAGELKKLGEAYAKAAAEYLGLEKKPIIEKSFYCVAGAMTKDEAEALQKKLEKEGYNAVTYEL